MEAYKTIDTDKYRIKIYRKITVDGKTFVGDEEIDSCWGFYGEESLMDYIKQYTLG